MDDTTANVLIVVDVQNCFHNITTNTVALASEIADLVETIPFDYYVVTHDSHPDNHGSHMVSNKKGTVIVQYQNDRINSMNNVPAFLGSPFMSKTGFEPVKPLGGLWPPHCISNTAQYIGHCKARKNLGATNYLKQNNNETNPSDLYKQFYKRAPILRYFSKPDMKLSLLDEPEMQYNEPYDSKFNLTVTNIPGSKDARGPVLQVLKGQLCNWDAYSAFQYHADFRRGPLVNDVRGNLLNTTGLAEVLFSKELGISHFKPTTKKVNIVVCGLVGEIGVKYTVSYGLNLLILAKAQGGLKGYDRIQSQQIGPLTAGPLPSINFIYSSYGTRFLPNPKFIVGDYGIRNEITSRISEANSSTNGVNYKLIIPEEKNFLDKIYPDGRLFGASIKSLTDALGITKVGGKRKTRRSRR
jgi:nicotinamidase-related amidase